MNNELKKTLALILDNQRLIMKSLDYDFNSAINQTALAVINLTKEKKTINTSNRPVENEVFQMWNGLDGLTKHSKIAQHMPAIKKMLRNADKSEVINSFINYASILNDPTYLWTKKWTLTEFSSRGFLRFHDEANPFKNISKVGQYGRKPIKQPTISNEEKGEYAGLFKERK